MLLKRFIVLLWIFFYATFVSGQTPLLKFRHLSDEQGLSNTTVNKILQDYQGFIWIATSDGLNRYDGYNFQVFRNDEKDEQSLSVNYINTIYEGKDNQLWIGTTKGLNRFDRVKRKFARFIHAESNKTSISNDNIESITEGTNGELWIATQGGGINVLDKIRGKFNHVKAFNSAGLPASNNTNVVYSCKNGVIWAGTSDGLYVFNQKVKTFQPVKSIFPGVDLSGISIVDIKEQNDNLWIGSQYNGLFLLDGKKGTLKNFRYRDNDQTSIGSNLVKQITVDRSGRVWVGCTNGGLNLFDPLNFSFHRYEHGAENRFSLSQRSVFAIYEDNQQNLWVGSPRGGINLYMPLANKFKLFRQKAAGDGLSYDDVRSFFQDKDRTIWIGTDGGGISLFRQDGTFIKKFINEPQNSRSLSSNAILNINGDKLGRIWISTYGGGINLYDKHSGAFKSFRHENGNAHSLVSDYVTKVFQDSELNIWVATTEGLNLFDYKKNEFKIINGNGPGKCTGTDFIDISEDNFGNIWILSLDGGITRYSLKKHRFIHYFSESMDQKDLAMGYTDSKNRFWVGKKGLYLYDGASDKFKPFPDKAKLSDEYVKGISEDNQGNLWISTSNGITRLNPNTQDFTKFNTGDGLQGREFEVKSCLKAMDGEIYFGGVNGFNSFYPDKIQMNRYDAPVFITALDIFNKNAKVGEPGSPLSRDISSTSEISLNPNQTSITLYFTALNYVVPENNKYLYKLDNFDKAWINSGTSTKAVYTNLNPGNYIFHVRAANNDGFWNTGERILKITVLPPFYATWWFRTFVLLSVVIAAYELFKFKHRLSLKAMEDQKNEEMHQVQLQFFTNISHEFRTPLSLIIGLLERIKQTDTSKGLAGYYQTLDRNASRLMMLINELMDFNKLASGFLKLKVRPIDLNAYLQNTVEDFKHMSKTKILELKLREPGSLSCVWSDPRILEKIILNLLNNSFKYTGAEAIITVDVFTTAADIKPQFTNELIIKSPQRFTSYFYVQVTDNGIGIAKESIAHLFERYYRVSSQQLGSGVGLAFVKSLTLLHKGDIYVYSEVEKGTQIIIALPLGKECYTPEERLIEGHGGNYVEFETNELKQEASETDMGSLKVIPIVSTENKHLKDRILLVDDNEELREFYKKFLSDSCSVREAMNGENAVQLAKSETFDLIISDVMMPVMDGIEFCKIIKNDLDTSHLPFIMLTAKHGPESQLAGIESGADCYLSKPVSLKLLQLSIRNILNHKRKLKDFYVKDFYADAKSLANTAKDKEFLDKLTHILDENIINPDLDIDFICQEIGMSHTKLYNKVKNITGQTVIEFTRSFRLKKAIQIMTNEDVSLNEIAYRVGIQTQSHFTKAFKKEFGKTPTQFLQEIQSRVD